MTKIRPYSFLLAYETTPSVTPTGNDLKPYALCVNTDGVSYSKEYRKEDKYFGPIDTSGQKSVIDFKLEGDIASSSYYEQLPVYYELLLGKLAPIDNGDGSFTHEFKSSTENNLTATAQTIVGKNDELFSIVNGLTASKTSINIEKGKEADISLSCMGMSYTDNFKDTTLTKLDETNKVELGKTGVDYNSVDIKIANTSSCSFSSISIDIDRGLKESTLLCPENKKDYIPEVLTVTGKLSALWDADLYNKVISDDLVQVEIEIKKDDKHKVYIKLEEVQFMFKSTPKKAGEVYNIEVDFTAVKVSATDKVYIAVTNEVSSY